MKIPAKCIGGDLIHSSMCFAGRAAEEYLETLHADFLFFSVSSLNEQGEITDYSEEETHLRRAMLKRAAKSYFLCDSSKIGKRNLFTVCHRNDLDGIFCDAKLPWEKD